MLIPTANLVKLIDNTIECANHGIEVKQAYHKLRRFVLDNFPIQVQTVPTIEFIEEEKAVTLYCTPDLWMYVNQLKSQNVNDINMVTILKIWSQIKPMLKGKI